MTRFSRLACTKFATKTATFTVDPEEASIYLVSTTGGNVTVNLPPAASVAAGGISPEITVKRTTAGANTLTLDGYLTETIDGATTKTVPTQYHSVTIASDGTAWHITTEFDG